MHGYYDIQTDKEAWAIDSIVDSVGDALANLSTFISTEDRYIMMTLKAQYLTTDLPKWLGAIE